LRRLRCVFHPSKQDPSASLSSWTQWKIEHLCLLIQSFLIISSVVQIWPMLFWMNPTYSFINGLSLPQKSFLVLSSLFSLICKLIPLVFLFHIIEAQTDG
jgi:hypothetical protein